MCIFRKPKPVFRPRYEVTDPILKNITRSTAAKELITQIKLPAEWVANFRHEALTRSAHASTSLEGNPLGYAEVSRLVVDRQVETEARHKQVVLNYLHGLESLDSVAKDHLITEERILKIHVMLTGNALENPAECGVYRTKEVTPETSLPGEIVLPAPPAKEVASCMKQMVVWLSSFDAEKLNPIIQAGIIHHEIMRIHPFAAGNGLVARYLATLLLHIRNFDTKRLFNLDDYYNANRNAYFEALKPVAEKNPDLTPWLEYFSAGVASAVSGVKDRVVALTNQRYAPALHVVPAPETTPEAPAQARVL